MSIYKYGSFEDIKVAINEKEELFTDTETVGLYGKIRLLQVYQKSWPKVILVEWPNPIQLAAFMMLYKTIWHNAHYDCTTVQQQSGVPFIPCDIDDTFLLARIAQPTYDSYSLDDVMLYALGYDPYAQAGLNKKILQKSNWDVTKLSPQQELYAAIDVYHMPDVWLLVEPALDTQSYLLDKSTLISCLKFQWNGLKVNKERLNAKGVELSQKLKSIHMPVNANSPKQVKEWLGLEGTDKIKLAIAHLRDGDTRAKDVSDVRSIKKLQNFIAKYSEVDYLVGKFKPSARSGRLTSDDENLQQIPRALKSVFGYEPGEGRVLIYSDYAQLELRTICAILKVSVMEQMFRAGVDLHGYVASVLFGDDWTKDDRQVTKTYNFNLLYGGSVNMVLSILITYGYLIEERLANRHKRKWLNMFKEIDAWQQEQISAWRKGKLGSTPLGREYKGNMMTDQMNIKNQGAGAEVAKLALHYFMPWLEKYNADNNVDVKVANFIHDSFILDAPDDEAIYIEVSQELARCMQTAWFEMSKCFAIHDLPMPVDVAVGYNWGDIENSAIPNLYEFKLDPYSMYKEL
jgi:DNA polymerase I-like protein with 3'-5' exonuclease and polymerase domains